MFILQHSLAINSGFRNSGLTVDKKGKIITAVRSTHGLEVPLSHKGQVLAKEDYIYFLVEVANQKMEEYVKQIERYIVHDQLQRLPKNQTLIQLTLRTAWAVGWICSHRQIKSNTFVFVTCFVNNGCRLNSEMLTYGPFPTMQRERK
uniref:tRNA wybutosine-synthesizing protein 3 homolog n=1 Tax=Salmo trutta TaxID=8032 RepID=A0A674D0C3_SALTR